MPALVSLLAALPLSIAGTAHAAEGGDPPPTTRHAAPAATLAATAPQAIAAPSATEAPLDLAPPAGVTVMAVSAVLPPATPAPRAIPAGPVWTDASGTWRQVGIASWYGGSRWQGRLTAAGVRYDDRQLTAAHASLPMGSRVRVTVAETGRSIVVTINDRPGTRKRIIDLSRAAAQELGILSRGIARVTLSPS
jgi:rare lipoprotein A